MLLMILVVLVLVVVVAMFHPEHRIVMILL